ncbi:MAG TPA: tetratricopeptide repeat protein [Gemmatimonadaceae bacterium]|nr:tetratricopeptide repeat protein [Gemmatimonadaceae bacterium]
MVALRDPLEQARALAAEALASWRGANPEQAIDACDDAIALLLPVGPSNALADVLRWKGSVLRDRGNHAAASDLYAQSLAVSDSIAYKPGRAHALNCMGTIAQFRGDLLAAERWYGEAALLAQRLGDRRLSGMVQQNLGVVAETQGRPDEAVAHFRLALSAFEQEEDQDAVLWVLNNLGVLHTREGAYGRAEDALDRARALATLRRDVASHAIVEENLAALYLATGRLDKADAAVARAYGIADQRHDSTRRAAAVRIMARVVRARDENAPQAIPMFERALALCQLGEDVQLRVEILSDLGDALRGSGETARARETWRRALEIARIAGFANLQTNLHLKVRGGAAERRGDAREAAAS